MDPVNDSTSKNYESTPFPNRARDISQTSPQGLETTNKDSQIVSNNQKIQEVTKPLVAQIPNNVTPPLHSNSSFRLENLSGLGEPIIGLFSDSPVAGLINFFLELRSIADNDNQKDVNKDFST